MENTKLRGKTASTTVLPLTMRYEAHMLLSIYAEKNGYSTKTSLIHEILEKFFEEKLGKKIVFSPKRYKRFTKEELDMRKQIYDEYFKIQKDKIDSRGDSK